jgi:hypothetical protein
MAQQQLQVRDLDPFEFMLLYSGQEKTRRKWLTLIAPISVGAVLLATFVNRTMGTPRDFQFWADIRRVMRVAYTPASQPGFPLMRDVTSWLLLIIVISGALLLDRQWKYMSECLSKLAKNDAIAAKDELVLNRISGLLGINRIVGGASREEAFDVLVGAVQRFLTRYSKLLFLLMLAASIALAALLLQGEQHGVFQVLAPSGLSPAKRQAWVNEAYRSWWAGYDNFFGYVVYQVLAVFAFFIILSFYTVGIVAIYVLTAMHFLVEQRADWLNRDGRFGWSPLARVYRTVMWANILLGVALTIILLALGIQNYKWIAVVVGLYIAFLPVFTFGPWLACRKVEEKAREVRVSEIDGIIARRCLGRDDVDTMAPFVAEISRCRKAKINPLRLGTVSLSSYVFVLVLPVVLAAAQIIVPIRFGHG